MSFFFLTWGEPQPPLFWGSSHLPTKEFISFLFFGKGQYLSLNSLTYMLICFKVFFGLFWPSNYYNYSYIDQFKFNMSKTFINIKQILIIYFFSFGIIENTTWYIYIYNSFVLLVNICPPKPIKFLPMLLIVLEIRN